MACETYPDGSSYCEDVNGWQYQDADGNYSYGYWDSEGKPIDANGLAVTIADTLSSIFGGGQRGYYAPDRNRNPYTNPNPYANRGNYPYQQQGSNFFPGSVSTQGFQINWWTAALGGLLIGAFFLGKRGR